MDNHRIGELTDAQRALVAKIETGREFRVTHFFVSRSIYWAPTRVERSEKNQWRQGYSPLHLSEIPDPVQATRAILETLEQRGIIVRDDDLSPRERQNPGIRLPSPKVAKYYRHNLTDEEVEFVNVIDSYYPRGQGYEEFRARVLNE